MESINWTDDESVDRAHDAVVKRWPDIEIRKDLDFYRAFIPSEGDELDGIYGSEAELWVTVASRLEESPSVQGGELPRFKCEHGKDSLRDCPFCMAEAQPRLTEKQLQDFRSQWHGMYINSLAQEVYERRKAEVTK